VLSVLAVILIISLLLSDVEEKTFEYGMLRTLGLRKGSLFQLLMMQVLLHSFLADRP
jgi:ABC-type lipoprotein release transport system permease subunit